MIRSLLLICCLFSATHGAAADIERGKTVYGQLCFTCHGPHLDGGIGPALNDQFWHHGSSPEAVLEVINKGIPGTEMIAYEAVFPEKDRIALRDFILSEQEGLREVVRAVYPREYFKGKRLTPALFDSVESLSQTPLPENWYYFERDSDGILRGTSKLYIRDAGQYHFSIAPIGRTSIFLDGEEVHYSDAKTDKSTHLNKALQLAPGVYNLEILHEEKKTHNLRFHGFLQQVGGKRFPLNGRSLQGNIPKIIKARPGQALVVRKWIEGLPPRALLCLLPNSVIVAWNPVDGQVLKAWHSAEINQTPSLPDRSAKPSEITGTPISGAETALPVSGRLRFLRYETQGEAALIVSEIDGEEKRITIAPEGTQSFTVSVK